jgi:parallel beta-helix repeat protein
MNWKLVFLVVVAVGVGSVSWGTDVSGNVSGDWILAGSPYIVVGPCTVQTATTLTIHPGVQVRFNGYFYIVSYGTLIAEGTVMDSIVFTSNAVTPNSGDWQYIRILNTGSVNSRFKYCDFSYGERGIYADNTTVNVRNCRFWEFSGRGIYTTGSDGEVRDCNIINSARGMKIENGTILVDHCSITGHDFAGISTSASAIVTIQYCNISDNTQQGIELTDGSSGNILWNTILRNGLDGINVADAGDTVFADRNVVAGNRNGIYITNATVYAWNNTVTQNDIHGVFFYNSHLRLGNCIVDRNANTGVYCQSSTYYFFYNDVWGNTTSDYQGCLPGAGCFSDDPDYVNPSSGGNGDYHLQETSPCIDAGAPFSELDPDGTRADVGVYYFDQNHPPEIIGFGPQSLDTVGLGQQITFWILAYDPDGDSLRYEWWHQEVEVGTDSSVMIHFTNVGYQRVVGKVLDGWGGGVDSMIWQFVVVDLAVPYPNEVVVPTDVWLGEAYPNPFNESAVIPFRIFSAGLVKIAVYDVLGREVALLFNQWAPAGDNQVWWDAEGIPSGIYYVILQSSNVTKVQKVVRLK